MTPGLGLSAPYLLPVLVCVTPQLNAREHAGSSEVVDRFLWPFLKTVLLPGMDAKADGCTDEKIHERRWRPNGREEDIGRGDARCPCPGECRGHRASLAWLWHKVQAGSVKKLGLDGPTDL